MPEDPLTRLIIESVDREGLAAALQPFLRIEASSGELVMLPDFTGLDENRKLLVYLLGRKAVKLLGRVADDGIEIRAVSSAYSGAPKDPGRVLIRLQHMGLAAQMQDGRYHIADGQVSACIQAISS